MTGKIEGRERSIGRRPELSGERRAAEEGALDKLQQRGHVEAGGGTHGIT